MDAAETEQREVDLMAFQAVVVVESAGREVDLMAFQTVVAVESEERELVLMAFQRAMEEVAKKVAVWTIVKGAAVAVMAELVD